MGPVFDAPICAHKLRKSLVCQVPDNNDTSTYTDTGRPVELKKKVQFF